MVRLMTTAVAALMLTASAQAADFGANGVADLEERIAELEATTAKKGNRKVSLTVYGQVNKGILFWDDGDESDQVVSENSSAESFVGFAGEAKINPNWRVGYVLEVGVGGYDDLIAGDDTNEIYTRNANLYIEGPMGRATLGHASQATDYIAEISTANTHVAARTLSLRPLNGPQVGEVLDLFDGQRANIVRYDTPLMGGFKASASWTNGDDDSEVWDAALRYSGEFSGFQIAAGVGYRDGIVIPTVASLGSAGNITVLSGSASVKHLQSGIFINAAAGQLSVEPFPSVEIDVTAWHLQGGVEQNWTGYGATTLFMEYASVDIDEVEGSPTLWGAGIIQAFDAAAFDLYFNFRILDADDGSEDDVKTGMAGAKIRF